MVKILEKIKIAPNIHSCTVEAPDVAKKALPGQFVIAIPDEFSERIPLTISDWDADKGTVTFVFLEIGASTEILAQLKEGENIYSFTGPLGKALDVSIRFTIMFIMVIETKEDKIIFSAVLVIMINMSNLSFLYLVDTV